MRNHSYENKFHLHVHFQANQIHFHFNGFARRLVLKLRQRATRKWPICLGRNCSISLICLISILKFKHIAISILKIRFLNLVPAH